MKNFYSTVLLLIVNHFATAQNNTPAFGKIEKADLQITYCPFEPDASAMKLFDVEEIEFQVGYDLKLKTERTVRIKIFNENGYKHASIKIPYFSKKGVAKLKNLRGTVYYLDASGKVVTQRLEKKDFFKDQSEDNLSFINFTFPNLKPGSIIEYSYSKIEKNNNRIEPWIIQSEIPVAYCERTILTPTSISLKEKVYGGDTIQPVRGKSWGRETWTYTKQNVRSFQYEPFMSSPTDNLLRVSYLLLPQNNFLINSVTASPEATWNYIGARFMESPYFGGQLKKKIPGTDSLIDSAKKIMSVSERIRFIFDTVNKRIPEKVEQALDADDIVEAWQNKNGNATEINLVLLNLLKRAQIECYPILVSTRSNGEINTNFPSSGQLNGVDVLALDSNKILVLDASLKWQSYQTPPFNVLNRKGFVLLDNPRWLFIEDQRPLIKQNVFIHAFFNDSGFVTGNVTTRYYDYAKLFMLDSVSEDNDYRLISNKIDGLNVLSKALQLPIRDLDPLEQKITFNYKPENTDNFYFFSPQFLSSIKRNPFINSFRNTDIDFGCNQLLTLSITLNIPSSYQVESLPKSITVRAPDSSFFFRRISSSDSVRVFFTQTFEIKRPLFGKEEYAALQEFFKRIYALMAEEIILKKKK